MTSRPQLARINPHPAPQKKKKKCGQLWPNQPAIPYLEWYFAICQGAPKNCASLFRISISYLCRLDPVFSALSSAILLLTAACSTCHASLASKDTCICVLFKVKRPASRKSPPHIQRRALF